MSASNEKPANHSGNWTAVLSRKIDRLRVPALTQKRPLRPGQVLGNKVAIALSRMNKAKVKALLESARPSVKVPVPLPPGVSKAQYEAMVCLVPECEGQSIMQILAHKISSGDHEFMKDFSRAMRPLSETGEDAVDLYKAMIRRYREIDSCKTPHEIISLLHKAKAGGSHGSLIKDEANFRKLLQTLGLPRKAG